MSYQIVDYSKNWTADEWIDYGILTFADPTKHYPNAFALGFSMVGTMWAQGYHGRGMICTDFDPASTYTNQDTSVYAIKSYNLVDEGWYSRPSNSAEAIGVLGFTATSSSETECLIIARRYLGHCDPEYAYCDVLIPYTITSFDDIKAIKVYAQAASRHANQTTGISVSIWQHDDANDDGSGVWEELTAKAGLAKLSAIDADGSGRNWSIFEEYFELSDGEEEFNKLAKSSVDTWGWYLHDSHKAYETSIVPYETAKGSKTHRGFRIRVKSEDSSWDDRDSGMNVGEIWLQVIRFGGETNQYPITGNLPQALRTSQSSLLTYATSGDFYGIAPSVQIIFDDFNDASYGANDYTISFADRTIADFFIGMDLYGLTHLAILSIIDESANYMWFYEWKSEGIIQVERTTLISTGFIWGSNLLSDENTQISYPKRQVIDKVILRGNPSLELTYAATSDQTATNNSTRAYFESLPHITTYRELQSVGDSLLARWGDLYPSVVVSLPYKTEYGVIQLGRSIIINYDVIAFETMRVQRIVYNYEAGEGLYVTYYLGNPQSPDTIRIRDQINKLNRRVHVASTSEAPANYHSTDFLYPSDTGGSGDETGEEYYLQADGTVELTDVWNAGDQAEIDLGEIALWKDEFRQSLVANATATDDETFTLPDKDGVGDELIPQTSATLIADYTLEDGTLPVLIDKIINEEKIDILDEIEFWKWDIRNDIGTSPYIAGVDDVAEEILEISGDVSLDITYDIDADSLTINDASIGITLIDGTTDTTITKTPNLDEVTLSGDIIVDTGVFAATTVEIGSQVLSESDYLYIASDGFPGLHIQDTGNVQPSAVGLIHFTDSNDTLITGIQMANNDFHLTSYYGNIKLNASVDTESIQFSIGEDNQMNIVLASVYPDATNTVDIGTSTQEYKNLYLSGQALINADWTTGTGLKVLSTATLTGTAIGIDIDFDSLTQGTFDLLGLAIRMPATYGAGTDYAAQITGDGRTVLVCSDLYAVSTVGDILFSTGNVLMDGATTDDERLRVPYLTAIPTSVDNGSVWMESDGLHVYYGGAEATLATYTYVPVSESVNIYERVRLVDFVWNSTDDYIVNTGTVRNQSYYCYIYPSIKSTCTKIEVEIWGSYNGVTGGVNSDMHCYLILRRLDGTGSWSTVSSTSYTYEDGTSGYQTLTISSPSLGYTLGRKYKLEIYKNATDGTAITTSTMAVVGVHITQ